MVGSSNALCNSSFFSSFLFVLFFFIFYFVLLLLLPICCATSCDVLSVMILLWCFFNCQTTYSHQHNNKQLCIITSLASSAV